MIQQIAVGIGVVGVLLLVATVVLWYAKRSPGTVPSAVTTVAGKIVDFGDQAAAFAALTTLRVLAAKRGDTAMADALKPALERIWTWDDPVEPKP